MRILRLLLPALATLALVACGSHGPFRDRGNDYLRAEVGKPLVYPDGLQPVAARELYPVPGVEQRRRFVAGEKVEVTIPPPPQLVQVDAGTPAPAVSATDRKVPPGKVTLTRDGNDYPVLMLDLAFDWAWQVTGDALKGIEGIKVEDIDRERAIFYVVVDGKRNSAGDPYQLKLNYTSNGIQVALQVDEDAMAPKDLSAPLMQKLRDGLVQ